MYTKKDLLTDPRFVNAADDEPVFALFGRDDSAPTHVRNWAIERRSEISLGRRPKSDQAQVDFAFGMATAMEDWREDAKESWRNGLFNRDEHSDDTWAERAARGGSVSSLSDPV